MVAAADRVILLYKANQANDSNKVQITWTWYLASLRGSAFSKQAELPRGEQLSMLRHRLLGPFHGARMCLLISFKVEVANTHPAVRHRTIAKAKVTTTSTTSALVTFTFGPRATRPTWKRRSVCKNSPALWESDKNACDRQDSGSNRRAARLCQPVGPFATLTLQKCNSQRRNVIT